MAFGRFIEKIMRFVSTGFFQHFSELDCVDILS